MTLPAAHIGVTAGARAPASRGIAFIGALLLLLRVAQGQEAGPSFAEWAAACGRLVSNRELQDARPAAATLPLRSFADFDKALGPFLELCRTGSLAQGEAWLDAPPSRDFFDLSRASFLRLPSAFEPFVQRLRLPAGSEVLFRADLHGDLRSLMGSLAWLNRRGDLNGFTVTRSNLFLVFLGDYADRGQYGMEVLYTLLRLRLANPERVHLLRGNHEDYRMVASYGLLAEGAAKFPGTFNAARLCRLFDFLPATLYLGAGTNFIQCSHGGMEPGFNPGRLLDAGPGRQYQRIERLDRAAWLNADHGYGRARIPAAIVAGNPGEFEACVPASPTTPVSLGFLWNDFTLVCGEPALEIIEGRGMVFGDELTRAILQQGSTPANRLRAVIRGHQHATMLNPMMARLLASRGLFRHWQEGDSIKELGIAVAGLEKRLEVKAEQSVPDGSVWTLNVAPDSAYGLRCGYDFDVMARLTVAEDFARWRLRRIALGPDGAEGRGG